MSHELPNDVESNYKNLKLGWRQSLVLSLPAKN